MDIYDLKYVKKPLVMVSFDVVSSFTHVPLRKITGITANCMHTENNPSFLTFEKDIFAKLTCTL